jgi:hypothetical protein
VLSRVAIFREKNNSAEYETDGIPPVSQDGNAWNSVSRHSAEDKKARNSFLNHFEEEKNRTH